MIVYLQMLEDLSDRDKFTLLYKKYRKLMLYVANQILNNQDDSEDAVHEAFLSIIRNIKKIQDADRPETRSYIVIITERKAINILQKRSSAIPYDESNELMGIAIPAPGDFGIADAFSQLPARYRELILLRYANGYSTKEIAALLGMSQKNVQKVLWRAKKQLEQKLDELGECYETNFNG
ncbi:sigma-70 family RNA polymerase sigma factor [uncultured Oscillibacter sp.]|uniref:RNA polymerase sigma factor n=1 Tax=uncultured Oscillibacter sp. TaxID=876091 RepID=UPI002602313C|nr:sigma-70 family RNA polymerase sigma factor [uncultured Oscillibacter sp.]